MPRLVGGENSSPVQSIWLYGSYDHHSRGASFSDTPDGIIDNDGHDDDDDDDHHHHHNHHHHVASITGYGNLTQATPSPEAPSSCSNYRIEQHQIEYSTQHSSDTYTSSFMPPRKNDNRSSIFRERDGRPPISNEYDNYGYSHYSNQYNQNYYYQQEHHHHYYHQQPFFPPSDPAEFSVDQRQDSSPSRVDRKRDRSLDSRIEGMDMRGGVDRGHADSSYYPSTYTYRPNPYSTNNALPYFEPEETPSRKRQYVSPSSPTYNNNANNTERDAKPKKFNPIYPHQGDKLTWQQSYENLQIYKKTYGDCNVPQKYKENPKLGGWVNKQRKKKKNSAKYGRLSESQTVLLDDLGFKWNLENACISSSV